MKKWREEANGHERATCLSASHRLSFALSVLPAVLALRLSARCGDG